MKGHVKWNEANLGEIEANKPVRQKITEPKTPYHRSNVDDESLSPVRGSLENCTVDGIDADVIHLALSDVASSSGKKPRPHIGWTWSDDELDPMDKDDEVTSDTETDDGSGMSFREHRRTHYDEYHKVKELLGNGSKLEDEVEANDINGKMEMTSTSSPPPAEMEIADINKYRCLQKVIPTPLF